MTNRSDPREIFGTDTDGNSVYRVRLTGGGLTAHVLTWGAVVQDLRLEGHAPPLVLGYAEFDHYLHHSPYFGATAGRYANRIAGGRFVLNGKTHQLDRNFLDKHTLHGGAQGCGKRNWQIADLGTAHVDLVLDDPDGHMGFPGHCQLICSMALKDDGALAITYTTKVTAPTIASLAHHSYFTLDDTGDIRDHVVQIMADTYLPVDDELIPTGEIAPVATTPFDFRSPKPVGAELDAAGLYDHNWCLAPARRNLQDVAHITTPHSPVSLTIATTEPGLQFYAGHKLQTPVAGLSGAHYGPYAGMALETQNWPDAPNRETFPQAMVSSDEALRQETVYRFEMG
ncbi:MAG: aldose epimerase family protein [Pseudomonadota bacterium]